MADTTLQFKLVTPVETVVEQDVEQVIVPTEHGQITVLPHHTALVSILQPGELIVKNGKEETPFTVYGGVLEMSNNQLVILADTAEAPSEIDLEEARKKAEELAKELESEEEMDITTYNTLKRQLQHEQARMGAAKKWRK